MKVCVTILSAAWMIGTPEPAQAPVLDFTVAARARPATSGDLPPGIVAGKPGQTISGTHPGGPPLTLPLKMTLTAISPGTCAKGEDLVYEVELTNTGRTPIVLPWSAFQEDAEPDVVPPGYCRMALFLMTQRPGRGPTVAGPVSIAVGSNLSAGSLRTVAPGERVVLRGLAQCPVLSEIATVRRTEFEGVTAVFATLSIQTKPGLGGPVANSAPVELTVLK